MFVQRSLTAQTFGSEHQLPWFKSRFEWKYNRSTAHRDEPDRRENGYELLTVETEAGEVENMATIEKLNKQLKKLQKQNKRYKIELAQNAQDLKNQVELIKVRPHAHLKMAYMYILMAYMYILMLILSPNVRVFVCTCDIDDDVICRAKTILFASQRRRVFCPAVCS